ncbi:MAG: hypothetical protein ABI882_02060 [Acidobacteriota bacterium]
MDKLRPLLFVLLAATLVGSANPQSPTKELPNPATLNSLLEAIGRRTQEYTDVIMGLAWTELIAIQELDDNFRPKGPPREYRYEAIVVRQPLPNDPKQTRLVASRELKTVDGKPASQAELKRGKCRDTNPSPVYGMPLSFLLSPERGRYNFAPVSEEQLNGRASLVVSVTPAFSNQTPAKPEIRIEGDCFSLGGVPPAEGRIWIDREREEVVQVSWLQPRPIEFSIPAGVNWKGPFFVFRPGRQIRLERQESRTRFERVSFEEPHQTVLMPVESESLTFLSGTGSPGLKTTTRYSQFKRFLTDVKVKETQ